MTLFFLQIYPKEIQNLIIRYVNGLNLKHKLKQWLKLWLSRLSLWKQECECFGDTAELLCFCASSPRPMPLKIFFWGKMTQLQGQCRFCLAESPAFLPSPASLQVWEVSKNGEWLIHKNGKLKEANGKKFFNYAATVSCHHWREVCS